MNDSLSRPAVKGLIGLRFFCDEGLSGLKEVVSELQVVMSEMTCSSVYKVVGRHKRPKTVHDLRSEESFEALSVVICGPLILDLYDVVSHLERLQEEQGKTALRHGSRFCLLAVDGEPVMTPQLTLPHPNFHRSPEWLIPAAEIWGDYEHPILKKSLKSLSEIHHDNVWGQFYAQGKSLLDF